jgi:hypothetical protein
MSISLPAARASLSLLSPHYFAFLPWWQKLM